MPESVPGVKRLIGFAGQAGLTSRPVGGVLREDLGQLGQRDAILQPVVGRVHHDRQRIRADAKLDRRAADRGAVLHLGVLDLTAGVGHVSLAGLAEALEARAGADRVDRDVARVPLVAELLGHRLAQREHRRGTGRDDVTVHVQRVDFRQAHAGRGRLLRSCGRLRSRSRLRGFRRFSLGDGRRRSRAGAGVAVGCAQPATSNVTTNSRTKNLERMFLPLDEGSIDPPQKSGFHWTYGSPGLVST